VVSFIGNFSLERDVKQAVADVRAIHTTAGQISNVDQLQKLDALRKQLEEISNYERGRVPWSLRWGLYSGGDIYAPARQAYFDRFGDLLFADTQGKLLNSLRNVKEKPGPADSYEAIYNDLKAYLVTTSNPEKSTKDFLPPILYSTWASGKSVDEQTIAPLVRNQFEFYSTELLVANPYSSSNEPGPIGRARAYLSNFGGIDRSLRNSERGATGRHPHPLRTIALYFTIVKYNM